MGTGGYMVILDREGSLSAGRRQKAASLNENLRADFRLRLRKTTFLPILNLYMPPRRAPGSSRNRVERRAFAWNPLEIRKG